MLFYIISIGVPLAVYTVTPVLVKKYSGRKPPSRRLLAIACFLFFISWYLPSPLIEGENTSFSTHFVGGGMFSAFLWLYIRKQLGKERSALYDLTAIYTLVSALGVANELFELAITKAGIVGVHPADTWWDLLANTLGALLVWVVFRLTLLSKK